LEKIKTMTEKAKKDNVKETKEQWSPMNYGTPYIIEIKNRSDDKHYDVKLLDVDHEKQKRVDYNIPFSNIGYEEVIRSLEQRQQRIKNVMVTASCDYAKFRRRQLSCVLSAVERNLMGGCTEKPIILTIDPFQFQDDRVVMKSDFLLQGSMGNIELNYLMPETDVTLYLYPEKIEASGEFSELEIGRKQ